MVKQADLIFAMDELVLSKQENSLMNQFPEYKDKFKLFAGLCKNQNSPKDPYQNKNQKDHKEIFDLIIDGVVGVVSSLIFSNIGD
jgi:protein-tyrosine-phosphatase